jgi:hypothetical protein
LDFNFIRTVAKGAEAKLHRRYRLRATLLASLSPYLTRHIKRYGDYVVDWKNVPQLWEQAIPLPVDTAET